ncbi:hypothetical protein SASPL_137353 [Salvia splendens]|uniref:Chaperonin GroES n=1 Tax=Salvia splendens TaxID=180675 RepID=A0A8X8WV30_SALSN|nr:hypothetical protein SASPL_137353 [Salvia splendens]
MASSSFIALTNPFTSNKPNLQLLSNTTRTGLRRSSLRVNAIGKTYEPAKVVPQADRVLIRLEELPEAANIVDSSWSKPYKFVFIVKVDSKSAGGVLLPKSAVKFERYLVGEVVSRGAEVQDVQTGRKVLFSDINAHEVDLGTDTRHCFCKAGDLLAVVN